MYMLLSYDNSEIYQPTYNNQVPLYKPYTFLSFPVVFIVQVVRLGVSQQQRVTGQVLPYSVHLKSRR